ncbi:MAG: VCBS repeat-containing protein [Verrucomicrobia bacterium]|nr:VCBS repeat-containing protein [Verrucomicrobiota bacterium]
MKRLFLIALAVSAALACPVEGYVLEDIVWATPNPTIYDNLTASEAKLGANLATFPLQDGSLSYDQVFDNAVADWNSYLQNLQIQAVDGTDPNGTNSSNSLSEAGFASSASGSDLSGDILAVTEIYYYPGNPSTFAPTDIVFNTAYVWNSYRGPLQTPAIDLRRVALHELGHFIGLGHPDQAGQTVNAIMNSVISNTDDLTADDIAGGQSLYGARTSVTPSLPSAPADTQPFVSRAGDFNGDGKQDLLLRNSGDSSVAVWIMAGLAINGYGVIPVATFPYRVFGFADLNGDGKSDVVWQSLVDASVTIWFMNGAQLLSSVSVNPPAPGYNLAAVGDLDGDGLADLVWRNLSTGDTVVMRNTGLVSGQLSFTQTYAQNVGTQQRLIAAANLTGEGGTRVELVWQAQDGSVSAWFFNNASSVSPVAFGQASAGAGATLQGVADLNGDGKDDLLWLDPSGRLVSVWYMNGTGAPVRAAFQAVPASLTFAGAANVNGNGTPAEVFWKDAQTGALTPSLLNHPPQPVYQPTKPAVSPLWTIQPQHQ